MSTASPSTDHTRDNEDATAFSNHLAMETSPYLRQHASNPVDWYPWCDEALDRARTENKPVFLSVGYSACHWCHVMERESFTDTHVAEILNQHFVSIKVDREERPDVDEIYMTAVQILNGSGGWPLNVFLTPDLEPFFGGTYFPPADLQGRSGFSSVLKHLARAWHESPGQIKTNAASLTNAVRRSVDRVEESNAPIDQAIARNAVESLKKNFDAVWGGFGSAPKFPPTGSIAFLLRQHKQHGSPELLKMAELTLDRMAQGGMHDQVGGGFHRYSVDERWLVPHFEKMLYDNALLARVYLEAASETGSEVYRRVARNTLDFVLRDMADPAGGFHSALDADSEGEEGKFYVWSSEEIESVLGEEDGALFREYFGVTESGNFEGSNILHYSDASAESVSGQIGVGEGMHERLGSWCERLRQVRAEREWPGKDDKVLASWNGLMISALARGYRVLENEKYLEAATRAADFVLNEMSNDGELEHVYSRGSRHISAFLDDYAEVANGMLDLYETTSESRWLEDAVLLTQRMIADFHDTDGGGFFFTSKSHDHLLVRTKPFHDGAVPSGNSTAALVLLRLSQLLDDADLRRKAVETLGKVQDLMSTHPEAFTQMLEASDFYLNSLREAAPAKRTRHSVRDTGNAG